jgi:hypothetical protein
MTINACDNSFDCVWVILRSIPLAYIYNTCAYYGIKFIIWDLAYISIIFYKAQPLADDEVDKLYTTGQMGMHNPDALLRMLWFQNTVHFGMHTVTEHVNMKWVYFLYAATWHLSEFSKLLQDFGVTSRVFPGFAPVLVLVTLSEY